MPKVQFLLNSLRIISQLLLVLVSASLALAQAQDGSRPNIIVILADDQRYDQVHGIMPKTVAGIFEPGVEFKRAYVTTPACCPSRASILTGKYASRHGVLSNGVPFKGRDIFNDLGEAGYRTGLVGKYLNSSNGKPRAGVDYWVSFAFGSTRFFNPRLFVNSPDSQIVPGYITDHLTFYALQFLEQSVDDSRPFFLYFTPNAPHSPAEPAKKYQGWASDRALPRPANFNPATVVGKPRWIKEIPQLSPTRRANLVDFYRRQLETLRSLDDGVGEILSKLEDLNLTNNTAIFYLSDNGLMYGEHRMLSKDVPYEGAIRVPFAFKYPKLGIAPRVDETTLVANIDIAPTIYELAALRPDTVIDGVSLLSILQNPGSQNGRTIMIEGNRETNRRRPFYAVHTGKYVLMENFRDKDELYDLESDPQQLTNLISNPAFEQLRTTLKQQLKSIRSGLPKRAKN